MRWELIRYRVSRLGYEMQHFVTHSGSRIVRTIKVPRTQRGHPLSGQVETSYRVEGTEYTWNNLPFAVNLAQYLEREHS